MVRFYTSSSSGNAIFVNNSRKTWMQRCVFPLILDEVKVKGILILQYLFYFGVQPVSRRIDQFQIPLLNRLPFHFTKVIAQHLLDVGRAGGALADQPVDLDKKGQG